MAAPTSFDIVPHVGIGPVRLGMTRAEVKAALSSVPGALPGEPKGSSSSIECYMAASIQIEFGKESKIAQFIGVSCHEAMLCLYKGRDVFDLAGPELFAVLAADDPAGPHKYDASGYLFKTLIVSLYEADEQYDRKRNRERPVFAEIGVGNSEYLKAIMAIRAKAQRDAAARESF